MNHIIENRNESKSIEDVVHCVQIWPNSDGIASCDNALGSSDSFALSVAFHCVDTIETHSTLTRSDSMFVAISSFSCHAFAQCIGTTARPFLPFPHVLLELDECLLLVPFSLIYSS
eukprot:146352_1